MITVNVTEISATLDIVEVGDCVDGQGVELFFAPQIDANPGLDGSEILSWIWLLDGVMIGGSEDMSTIFRDMSGTYSVEYSIEYQGFTCMEFFFIDLDLDEYAFDFDPLFTYDDVCEGEIVEYEIDFSPFFCR
jgi:hypothetical protein